ncbi:MAG: TSUP family transporter [Candidatus Dormibacteraeota bacterium]|nr:TSUP family transporter [Candidatus Dormibacteraeota bacterium]
MHLETVAFLAAAGFCAGLVDSVVGGGGVISLPALLLAGVPPQLSLGTNKLAGTCASLTASAVFARARRLDRRVLEVALAPVAIASAMGAFAATHLQPGALRLLILGAVLVAAAWAGLRPVREDAGARRPAGMLRAVGTLLLVAIGFYDGILGPGTGLFLFAVLAALEGLAFVEAAGTGRALNLASNVGALLVFAVLGKVDVLIGLTMGVGVVVGARTGATLAIRRGAAFVRPMLVLAAVLIALRLALQLFGR